MPETNPSPPPTRSGTAISRTGVGGALQTHPHATVGRFRLSAMDDKAIWILGLCGDHELFCRVAPRPRNAEVTRAAILTAARNRFARYSYDDVGMRDIAGDVGVDAALVSRYFGSKEELFVTVLDHCGDGPDLMDGDRATFGDRVAREAIFGSPDGDDGRLAHLLVLLRSIGSSKATELVQRSCNECFFDPFETWIGGPDAVIRARLAAAFIMGMTVSRELTGATSLSAGQCAQMHACMARILQDIIDG
ncbi:MAG: TetR family transcriptional regulator [Cypionkella sp.]|uniref:TetR/AcrR family transcriptional regulator n=1 Tax=Cypionkella sp. TaxID=2811411 RepID=UPI00272F8139|nr:TetR/AcrR family transcriptional regulator [Cypionkella sp.]MDP2048957.1 TetR family transcriptional regulator [Cypionkella sp.]